MKEVRCNEWDCPCNKKGKCTSTDCPKMDEILDTIHSHRTEETSDDDE